MTITLPNTLRRAELRSFCLALCAIAVILLTTITGFSLKVLYAGAVIICATLIGLVAPGLVRIPYRIWNKAAKLYARFASIYIMVVAFHLVVQVMGTMTSSRQMLRSTNLSSFWNPLGSVSARSYASQHLSGDELPDKASWPLNYLFWSWRTRNIPAMFLLPFLMMISVFQSEYEASKPSDIYTLF